HAGQEREAGHVAARPEFIRAEVLIADNQLLRRVDADDASEHFHFEAVRQNGANLLDSGDGPREIQLVEVERFRRVHVHFQIAKARQSTPRRTQPITSSTWLNSVSMTSGRKAGSLSCSAVAAREFLSPAKRAVRKPCFLAGPMSRGKLEPTCSVSPGRMPRSPSA